MTSWLTNESDFFAFLHAAVWALCASEMYASARVEQRPAWGWLGHAAALKSGANFLSLLRFTATEQIVLTYAAPLLEGAAYCAFYYVAWQLKPNASGRSVRRWLLWPVAAFCLGAIFTAPHADAWTRLSLGLCSMGAVAFAFSELAAEPQAQGSGLLRGAAAGLLGYAFGAAHSSLAVLGFVPPEWFGVSLEQSQHVAELGFIFATLFCLYLRRRRIEAATLERRAGRQLPAGITARLVLSSVLLGATWFGAHRLGGQFDQARRADILSRVRLGAAAIPVELVDQLSWSKSDLENPAYQRLKALLTSVVHSEKDLRFVLLAGLREGQAIFLADSESPTSADYSPPGDVYEEASADYLEGMRSRSAFTVGPVTDRWGTWIIASAPLPSSDPSRLVNAELDISASDWDTSVRAARLPAFLVGFCVLIVSLTFFQANDTIAESLRKMRTARDAAEAASRAKSEFLAVMSHEIRTPLGAVIGMLELLRKQPSPEDVKRYTVLARHGAESLLHILDDILDAAKVEAGKIVLEEIDFDVREEFTQVLEGMRVRAESKHLWLRWKFEEDVPRVLVGDPTRFKQVIANLCSNAVKFTSTGGVDVTVSVRSDIASPEAKLEIAVQDTGIGMAPEVCARLFKKFEQADASTTRQFGGTGLGLAIVKGLVEQMQGQVSVSSEPGKGTRFSVVTPLKIGAEVAVARGDEPADLLHGPPLTILYAEDDPVNREYLGELLRRAGHHVTFAENGRVAVDRIRNANFDLVLMDNRMPEMDGFQASRAIRAGSAGVENASLYIIAVTANASQSYSDSCLAAGMNDFITKPVRPAALAVALQRAAQLLGKGGGETAPLGLSAEALLASAGFDGVTDEDPELPPPTAAVLQIFLSETPRRLEQLRSSLDAKDAASLGRAAHTLKGSSRYAGASQLANLGAEIEILAEQAEFARAAPLVASAEEQFTSLKPQLERQLQSLTALT